MPHLPPASPDNAPRAASRDPVRHWRDWLGINSSTLALLGAILLVTASTELWSPLIPGYLRALRQRAGGGETVAILLIGVYGLYRDGLEAVNYYVGGAIAGRFNTRRSLLLFNALPLIGLGILCLWDAALAVFLAIPFIFVWDSIAGPATITVVGDSLPPDRRTMAFSLQAIFRRVSRIVAYCISAPLILWLGEINGVRADALIAIALVLAAAAVQYRFMRTASRDATVEIHRPRRLFSRFPRDLRRLLYADICARWAEGLAGPLVIVYCLPLLATNEAAAMGLYQSLLLNIQAVTNILLYVLVGPLASRAGLAKKPFIGLTFVFFALFPISLAVLPALFAPLSPGFGLAGLCLAFVVGGMREIGEPARKAMIADLVPQDVRTQATGLYWSVRSAAVMAASPAGALLWVLGNWWRPGNGPPVMLCVAGVVGMCGAAFFYRRFGRDAGDPLRT